MDSSKKVEPILTVTDFFDRLRPLFVRTEALLRVKTISSTLGMAKECKKRLDEGKNRDYNLTGEESSRSGKICPG